MKKWRLMALLAVVALLVAACGDDAEETTTTTAAPTTTTAAPFEGLSYAAPDCTYGGEFSKIEAVDALTVRFELCFPDVAFRSKVAFSAFAIQSSDHLEATGGGGDALISNPIGTGPYMLEQWDRGNQLILTKNPNYWGDPAIAETLVFRWSTEAAQRLVELQAGSVDGIDNIGPEDFATVANDPNLQLIERPALNIFYIGFNNNFPPLDNEQVRQALAMAIDKQRIVDNFYPAGSSMARQFLPAGHPRLSPRRRSGGSTTCRRPVRCSPPPGSPTASTSNCPTATSSAATCRSRPSWPWTSRPSWPRSASTSRST